MPIPALVYFCVLLGIYCWLGIDMISGSEITRLPPFGMVDTLTAMAFTSLLALLGVAGFVVPMVWDMYRTDDGQAESLQVKTRPRPKADSSD